MSKTNVHEVPAPQANMGYSWQHCTVTLGTHSDDYYEAATFMVGGLGASIYTGYLVIRLPELILGRGKSTQPGQEQKARVKASLLFKRPCARHGLNLPAKRRVVYLEVNRPRCYVLHFVTL